MTIDQFYNELVSAILNASDRAAREKAQWRLAAAFDEWLAGRDSPAKEQTR